MPELKIRGFAELAARMKAYPVRLQRRALSAAVRAGAVVVRDDAKVRAPKASGVLIRGIQVKQVRSREGVRYIIGVETGKVGVITAGKVTFKSKRSGKFKTRRATRREKAGEDPFYYRFQELGYKATGRKRGGSGRTIPGKRFLTNAIERGYGRALAAMRVVLAKRIETLGER